MDTFSLVTANLLVGNDPNDACLEMTLIGAELQALRKTQIAITGGDISPRINGRIVPMWQTVDVQKGDIVSFGRMESGCRGYLSVRGGINTQVLLGSRSTYVRGGFGMAGRQLRVGDFIDGFEVPLLQEEYSMPKELVPKFTNHFTARVILGPQAEMFTERGVDTFLSNPYKITPEADRMGYRLEGSVIEHKAEADIISDALLPGAIQVPRNGKPILIMRDAQTTGGYPKIAVALTSDVNHLGQAKPGNTIQFLEITMEKAQEKAREFYGLLKALGGTLIKRPREP
jgi:biotin-dependent carboxylase-like uncharacterized protein